MTTTIQSCDSSCNDNITVLCISKNHRYKPYCPDLDVEELYYRYHFYDESKYVLPAEYINDQWDWCKLTGVSFHVFGSNTKDSYMCAFRYIPWLNEWHFAEYYHINGDTHWSDPLIIINDIGYVEVHIWRDLDAGVMVMELEDNSGNYATIAREFPWLTITNDMREIGTWFGGNQDYPDGQQGCIIRENLLN